LLASAFAFHNFNPMSEKLFCCYCLWKLNNSKTLSL